MAKRSHRSLSKKGLPFMKRITKDGVRIWEVKYQTEGLIKTEEFITLREVVMRFAPRI